MEMFDEVVETRIADGKAQVRTLFDEGDLAAMEFAEACEALVAAERKFEKSDRSPRTGRMYLQFREALLAGGKLRADA